MKFWIFALVGTLACSINLSAEEKPAETPVVPEKSVAVEEKDPKYKKPLYDLYPKNWTRK